MKCSTFDQRINTEKTASLYNIKYILVYTKTTHKYAFQLDCNSFVVAAHYWSDFASSQFVHFSIAASSILLLLISEPQQAKTSVVPQQQFEFTDDRTSLKCEARCRWILENKFRKPFKKARPSFLRNPKTGRNLEVDMYNEELKLAVEYNGAQHYQFTPKYHRSELDFQYQQEKDALKVARCKEQGIQLIVVPYTVGYKRLSTFLEEKLKKRECVHMNNN